MRALLLVLLVSAAASFEAGMQAYQEGRFAAALEAFRAAEQAAGDQVSAELLYNKGLAALRAGQLAEASQAAGQAGARGSDRVTALCDFLQGNVALARCERAAALASKPDAIPADFDRAVALAAAARDHWQAAALSRPDWPAARRNVERALLKLRELRAQQEAASNNVQRKEPARPRPKLLFRQLSKSNQDKRRQRSQRRRPVQVEQDW